MITIKEIASKLGLSTTTVSNVIHGKTKEVSADTIERVQKFLEEVEYVPNINARNLAQGQSKIIVQDHRGGSQIVGVSPLAQ